VRELEHELHLMVRLDHGGVIDLEHLPARVQDPGDEHGEPPQEGESLELRPRVDALERTLVREAMRRAAGRQTVAARLLGVSRNGLAHMLKRLGLGTSAS
jgi:DNA-binding NtrC family response regulator